MANAIASSIWTDIMASGAERQQRLTGEAFQRLRNDHEQFLEAYESEGHVVCQRLPKPWVEGLCYVAWVWSVTDCRSVECLLQSPIYVCDLLGVDWSWLEIKSTHQSHV